MTNPLTFLAGSAVLLGGLLLSPSVSARTVEGTGYTLNIPDSWEAASTRPGALTDLVLRSPVVSAQSGARSVITVTIDTVWSDTTRQEWLKENQQKLQNTGAKLVTDFSPVTLGSNGGYVGRFRLESKGETYDYDCYVIFDDKTAYVLACVIPSSSGTEVRSIVDSFTLTKK